MPAHHNMPRHGDAGLQPERTDLAWARTTLSLLVAAAVFLRWMPHHGWFVGTLVAAAVVTALAISLTRKRRFRAAITGINREYLPLDITSKAAVATSTVIVAALGIHAVLYLPVGH
jgi:uncharacterized membrane protein YidH (DUF202 family)